jgi:hypothetical protein
MTVEQVQQPIIGFRSWTVQPEPRKPRPMPQPPRRITASADLFDDRSDFADYDAMFEEAEQRYFVDLHNWKQEIEAAAQAPAPYSLLSLNGGGHFNGMVLDAAKGGTVWHGAVAHFRCPYGHTKPQERCSCGLHAVFGIEQATWGGNGGYTVTGATVAWGRIVFHALEGFRAEHLRIVALAESPNNEPQETYGPLGLTLEKRSLVEKAGEKIGVPVVDYKYLTAHAREHGRLVTATWEYRYE